GAASASGESCPGAGNGPCPYSAVRIIGQRAEGMRRFPEAVAVDGEGNVYVADQLSFVVQKFNSAGTFVTEWGSYGGGAGPVVRGRGAERERGGRVAVCASRHKKI